MNISRRGSGPIFLAWNPRKALDRQSALQQSNVYGSLVRDDPRLGIEASDVSLAVYSYPISVREGNIRRSEIVDAVMEDEKWEINEEDYGGFTVLTYTGKDQPRFGGVGVTDGTLVVAAREHFDLSYEELTKRVIDGKRGESPTLYAKRDDYAAVVDSLRPDLYWYVRGFDVEQESSPYYHATLGGMSVGSITDTDATIHFPLAFDEAESDPVARLREVVSHENSPFSDYEVEAAPGRDDIAVATASVPISELYIPS